MANNKRMNIPIRTINKNINTSRHISARPFVHKALNECFHVFKRVDSIRKPLDPPYTGPHEVLKRIDDKTFVIRSKGMEKTVSTDGLKRAFLEAADTSTHRSSLKELRPTSSAAATLHSSPPRVPLPHCSSSESEFPSLRLAPSANTIPLPSPPFVPSQQRQKSSIPSQRRISFPSLPAKVSGEGVVVAH